MKISINDQEFFTLTDLQKKVLCNEIRQPDFEQDMKRRVHYVLYHKYEQCLQRLKEEWAKDKVDLVNYQQVITPSKLKSRGLSIPSNDSDLLDLIFSQPDYKCQHTRDLEEARKKETSDAINNS